MSEPVVLYLHHVYTYKNLKYYNKFEQIFSKQEGMCEKFVNQKQKQKQNLKQKQKLNCHNIERLNDVCHNIERLNIQQPLRLNTCVGGCFLELRNWWQNSPF